MIYMTCGNCGWKTGSFLKYEELYNPIGIEGHEVEEESNYSIHEGAIYIHHHQDRYLLYCGEQGKTDWGCCGPGPLGGLNMACQNCKWPIGRMVEDCCMGHYIKIFPKKVTLKQCPADYAFRLYELDVEKKIDSKAMNELLVLWEYQFKTFKKRIKSF